MNSSLLHASTFSIVTKFNFSMKIDYIEIETINQNWKRHYLKVNLYKKNNLQNYQGVIFIGLKEIWLIHKEITFQRKLFLSVPNHGCCKNWSTCALLGISFLYCNFFFHTILAAIGWTFAIPEISQSGIMGNMLYNVSRIVLFAI